MTSRDFCYWLQGFFELVSTKDQEFTALDANQTALVKRHLNLVFKHEIDPSMGDGKHQAELNAIHNASLGTYGNWGPSLGPGYELSTLHGWYDPREGVPRC